MKKSITVKTNAVLEARPLAELVALAERYKSSIVLQMEEKTVNAKSIMGIMGLGLDIEKEVFIEANGEDEEEAIAAISDFLEK